MGVEWINKTGKTFRRSMGRGYDSLKSTYLFDPGVSAIERSFRAKLCEGYVPPADAEVIVRVSPEGVRLYDAEERVIGLPDNPPEWLTTKLSSASAGMALGVIEDFRPMSGSADVVMH
jgi:hypothetical protein